MKNRAHKPLFALSLAVLLAVGSALPADAYRTENVVVVVIDGVRLSESFEDPTHQYIPRMWNDLVPIGMRIPEFRNEGRTETVAGHAALVTGTWQELPDNGLVRPTMPTFFEYFRAASGSPIIESWIVAGKFKLNSCSYSTHPLYGINYQACAFSMTRPDPYTYADYMARLAVFQPQVSVLCLTQTDYDAHYGDWEDYVSGIALADSLVMDLWTWLQTNPHYAGNTTMFVTSDHGRHLDNWHEHGDGCEGCRRVGFLAVGPDFAPGAVLDGVWHQIDLCPTVAELLDFPAALARGTSFFRAGIELDPGTPLAGPGPLIREVGLAPNPFNPLLQIRVDLGAAAPIAVDVMDVKGRKVRSLWSGIAGPGALAFSWDGRSADGTPQAAGFYTIVVHGEGEKSTRKAVLVK